jgi:hypothetical protein
MDIARVQWPAEADRRVALRRQGVRRLLLVAKGDLPPDDLDVLEDWARCGTAEQDVAARELTLSLRAAGQPPAPHFDDDGPRRDRLQHAGLVLTVINSPRLDYSKRRPAGGCRDRFKSGDERRGVTAA